MHIGMVNAQLGRNRQEPFFARYNQTMVILRLHRLRYRRESYPIMPFRQDVVLKAQLIAENGLREMLAIFPVASRYILANSDMPTVLYSLCMYMAVSSFEFPGNAKASQVPPTPEFPSSGNSFSYGADGAYVNGVNIAASAFVALVALSFPGQVPNVACNSSPVSLRGCPAEVVVESLSVMQASLSSAARKSTGTALLPDKSNSERLTDVFRYFSAKSAKKLLNSQQHCRELRIARDSHLLR